MAWSSINDEGYKMVQMASCSERNVVFALICLQCDRALYVGETESSLKERTEEHLPDMCQQADKSIMRQGLNEPAHVIVILTTYANSEGLGATVHWRSLTRAFAVCTKMLDYIEK